MLGKNTPYYNLLDDDSLMVVEKPSPAIKPGGVLPRNKSLYPAQMVMCKETIIHSLSPQGRRPIGQSQNEIKQRKHELRVSLHSDR